MPKNFSISLGDLLAELEILFLSRREKVQKLKKIDFAGDGGEKLYQDGLDVIIATMIRIKNEQGEKVSGCSLFDNVLDPDWQKKFKENFYKLFIDRLRCDNSLPHPHRLFNRTNLKENNSGADLCYAEGFVIGFASMLQFVELEFQKKQKADLTDEEFVNLFKEFNAIAVGTLDQDQSCTSGISAGHLVLSGVARERAKTSQRYGKVTTKADGLNVINHFSATFNHVSCAGAYYKIYRERIAKGDDVQDCLCELVDAMGTDVHLCRDGNGRGAILLAWFLAISQNTSHLTPIDQFFYHPKILEEASGWNNLFMGDPSINTMPAASKFYILAS